jgi:hypothetical protein
VELPSELVIKRGRDDGATALAPTRRSDGIITGVKIEESHVPRNSVRDIMGETEPIDLWVMKDVCAPDEMAGVARELLRSRGGRVADLGPTYEVWSSWPAWERIVGQYESMNYSPLGGTSCEA